MSRASPAALHRHGVAHLSIANDMQEQAIGDAKRARRNLPGHTGREWFAPVLTPPKEEIEKAAALLNSAKRVAVLIGRGADGAREKLEETARLLAA